MTRVTWVTFCESVNVILTPILGASLFEMGCPTGAGAYSRSRISIEADIEDLGKNGVNKHSNHCYRDGLNVLHQGH